MAIHDSWKHTSYGCHCERNMRVLSGSKEKNVFSHAARIIWDYSFDEKNTDMQKYDTAVINDVKEFITCA